MMRSKAAHLCGTAGLAIGVILFVSLMHPPASGETTWSPGLSDRELAIQRWFSHLTYQQGHGAAWEGWHDDGSQLGVTAFRYQLAFCAYGCVAMAAKTPAYRDLLQRQLLDLCERMIDRRTWFWTPHYWDYGDDPPDPCKYENVMYTGHLTQMMCLYELITGDKRYSEEGWDFVWTDGRKTHYTLEKAVRGLYEQSKASPTGGICCEPGLVFSACNSHSAASFMLHDLIHGTNYAEANTRWYEWMKVNFRNKIPFTREFLYVTYNQNDGYFIPVGDVGADGWTLGFSYPWFPDRSFLDAGWKYIDTTIRWISPAANQCYAKNNQVVGCCGGGSLGVANGFALLTGVQAVGHDAPRVRKLHNWLEANFGKTVDSNGDGHEDAYLYETCPIHRISATGIIAAALATEGDSMRNLYRSPRTAILEEPTLAEVDYPNVYIRAAEFKDNILRFVVLKGNPSFSGNTELVCTPLPVAATVFRNGAPWASFVQKEDTLRITTDINKEYVFEVRLEN